MFRGYPLRRLADAVGPGAATVVLALGFGAAHLVESRADVLVARSTSRSRRLWLGVAFFSRGGMALAWGLHLGWNAGLSLVFDAPVSGPRRSTSRAWTTRPGRTRGWTAAASAPRAA